MPPARDDVVELPEPVVAFIRTYEPPLLPLDAEPDAEPAVEPEVPVELEPLLPLAFCRHPVTVMVLPLPLPLLLVCELVPLCADTPMTQPVAIAIAVAVHVRFMSSLLRPPPGAIAAPSSARGNVGLKRVAVQHRRRV